MNVDIEISVKVDGGRATKYKLSVPHVESKWPKKFLGDPKRFADMMLAPIVKEFPRTR